MSSFVENEVLPAIYQFNSVAQFIEVGAVSTKLGKAEISRSLFTTIPVVLAMLGVACVYLMVYMESVALTMLGVLQIGMSLGISFFIYDVVFGFDYFGILNFLGAGIALGIGVDAVMIIMEASRESLHLDGGKAMEKVPF